MFYRSLAGGKSEGAGAGTPRRLSLAPEDALRVFDEQQLIQGHIVNFSQVKFITSFFVNKVESAVVKSLVKSFFFQLSSPSLFS